MWNHFFILDWYYDYEEYLLILIGFKPFHKYCYQAKVEYLGILQLYEQYVISQFSLCFTSVIFFYSYLY